MERVVIALGGSVVAPRKPDPHALLQWTEAIKEWSQEVDLAIVVGGGEPAREWIEFAREIAVAEDDLDRIGIQATRLNAQVFATFLRANGVDVRPRIPITIEKAVKTSQETSVFVMGGTDPGHSTDQVAVSLAGALDAARVVIVTNVDGVYTSDPNKDADAERITSMTCTELLDLVGGPEWAQAGSKTVVDGPAAALLCEGQLEARVVSGRNLTNVGQAIRGADFDGTRITPVHASSTVVS